MKKGRWFTEKCLSWPKYTSSPLCCWLLLSAIVTGSLKRCFLPFSSCLITPRACALLHDDQWRPESILGSIGEEGMRNMSCPSSAGAVQGESYWRHFTPEGRRSQHWAFNPFVFCQKQTLVSKMKWIWNEGFETSMANISSSVIQSLHSCQVSNLLVVNTTCLLLRD